MMRVNAIMALPDWAWPFSGRAGRKRSVNCRRKLLPKRLSRIQQLAPNYLQG
jgi:hypothetical protein